MEEKKYVMVVDDLPEIVSLLKMHLEEEGYGVSCAASGSEALEHVNNGFQGVIVLDLQLPDLDGMDVFRALLERTPSSPVIILSAFASFEQVAAAIELGAFDFISKADMSFERVLEAVGLAWNSMAGRPDVLVPAEPEEHDSGIVGESPAIMEVTTLIQQVVNTRVTVLLEGESGTGKEVVARAIHTKSRRSKGPFIAINCAGIPPSLLESELFGHERGAFTGAVGRKVGKFEQANGGTVFLDEIGEVDLSIQSKLLRVLQEKEVARIGGSERIKLDVRIVSATNRELEKEVAEMRFRADLFYRLAVFRIILPPLRERLGDLKLLSEFILERFAASEGLASAPSLTKPALSLLEQFPFPGNVRELENILSYAAVVSRGNALGIYDLPQSVHQYFRAKRGEEEADGVKRQLKAGEIAFEGTVPTRDSVVPLSKITDAYMRHVLAICDGNVSEAAKRMGVARQTVYRRLPEFGG